MSTWIRPTKGTSLLWHLKRCCTKYSTCSKAGSKLSWAMYSVYVLNKTESARTYPSIIDPTCDQALTGWSHQCDWRLEPAGQGVQGFLGAFMFGMNCSSYSSCSWVASKQQVIIIRLCKAAYPMLGVSIYLSFRSGLSSWLHVRLLGLLTGISIPSAPTGCITMPVIAGWAVRSSYVIDTNHVRTVLAGA